MSVRRLVNYPKRLISWVKRRILKLPRVLSNEQKRAVIDQYRQEFACKNLVETGTFMGDTVAFFENKMSIIYSIELSPTLAQRAKKRFEQQPHIHILEGDSSVVLKEIVPKLVEPTLFWLDGHFSSSFFWNDEFVETAKGKTNTPIEAELEILLNSAIPSPTFVILIDDARLFTGQNDYPSYQTIKQIVSKSTSDYRIFMKKDIIHIIPT